MQQELGVLVAAVLVHAAAGVALALVAQVQLVMLVRERQRGDAGAQLAMAYPGAALAAVRLELVGHHPHRNASLAAVAVRPVGEDAAAAEAVLDQLRIDIGINQVRRSGNLRAGLACIQVTAGVGRCGVKLQRCKWQIVQVRHARPISAVATLVSSS